ncbi:MAG: LPS-assembly protein LptD [Mariniphaga sp.]|nr:LPS-assembly protein LptD [Mariniphaga sp.]
MSKLRFLSSLGAILFLVYGTIFGQTLESKKSDVVEKQRVSNRQEKNKPYLEMSDSIRISKNDSLASDSIATDETTGFDAEVEYTADGYITLIQNSSGNKIIMSKNAQVKYKDIDLKADYIELNRDSNLIYAVGKPDSTGAIAGKPIFKQGEQEFQADEVRYNYKTKKGIVTGVVTEQEGGFVHSGRTKLINDSTYCLRNGKYTTCDAEHPHFWLEMTKAKVLSNKKIVTGPAYLVIEDMPLYFIFVPFGFFPNSPKYSSGLLMPSYGDEVNRGFFLRDIGYYWAANDYFDASVKGDLYSKGSRGIKLHTNYRLRYRFSGAFDLQYYKNVFGDKGLPDYKTQNDFAITWSHSMDAKSSPTQTFSASVNFSTSSFDQNNSYTTENYLTNTKQSSISYSKRWENSPFNLSANMRHSQNSRDTTISLTLPQMTFNMSRIYPFKSKLRIGKEKWYEKIGVSYSMDMQNTINTKENKLMGSSLTKDWQNGIKHSIPVSTSFKALKYITVSPSVNYNERWYTQQIRKKYNEVTKMAEISDTLNGFTRDYDYSVSIGTSTKIYGNFAPLNPKSSIKGIRHVMTPSVSFSLRPDFSNPNFGMYGTLVDYIDEKGNPVILRYPYHEGAIFGTAGAGKSGSIGFSLGNTLEMKKVNTKDTTASKEAFTKVKLLDQLSIGGSYNLAADSLNLSNITISARTKVAGVDLNFGAILDPYAMQNGRLINQFEFSRNGRLARLTSANMSFGLSFKSKEGKEKEKEEENLTPEQKTELDQKILRQRTGDIPEYADFSVPWDLSFNYSFRYSKPDPMLSSVITQTVDFNGNVSLTKQWKVGFSSGIDVQKLQVTFTQFNIFRDLHCMQMSLNLVPFGYRQSYSFTIRATSTLLQDLKLSKRQSSYDNGNY